MSLCSRRKLDAEVKLHPPDSLPQVFERSIRRLLLFALALCALVRNPKFLTSCISAYWFLGPGFCSSHRITAALIESAKYRSLVGNLDIMPKACHEKSSAELATLIHERVNAEKRRIDLAIDESSVEALVKATVERLEKSLDDGTDSWQQIIPGKQLLNRFAHQTRLDSGRLKTMYLREAEKHSPSPFADIISIFEQFSAM